MRTLILGVLLAASLLGQTSSEEFRVYTSHPRLFLRPQRVRLLKRERERQSMRWRQFETLVRGSVQMPEPGFALAFYAAISEDTAVAQRAIAWALGGAGSDVRQLAFVYDWCQDSLTAQQSEALAAKIRAAISRPAAAISLTAQRDRVLGAIAIADDASHPEEAVLKGAVEEWFRREYAPSLAEGHTILAPPDAYPLIELMHAIRDNLNIDLREAAPMYFRTLPEYMVLANYPAPYRAPENEYRVPVYTSSGQPDLIEAALSRAAGLSMVGYETNARETQYLQGWLIQDRFMMRGTFGAPYEFLWANPYQPGLSYFYLPLTFHDPRSGALFVRSSWEEEAVWFGLFRSEAQLFEDGKITVLNARGALAAKPIAVGTASILAGSNRIKFRIDGEQMYVVGLVPHHRYLVEVDDEEMREEEADAAGTIELQFPPDRIAGIRMEEVTSEHSGT
jgi:hypothetical protein